MNIVILGAGTVGTSVAELLVAHNQNVVLVDSARSALRDVEERLDVRTVTGSACDAITLFQAGVQSADLCLAVTSHDEVNLVGASLAKAMGASRSVARIFNPAYTDFSTFDYRRHFGIDRLLSLEHLTALELAKGIRQRGLFAIENFARGGIEVQELAVAEDSRAIGVPLRELKLPGRVRIALISNGDRTIVPGAEDTVQAGDHVTLIGTREDIEGATRTFEPRPPRRMNVIIAGGGETGYQLARLLQADRFNVVLMESNAERCEFLARQLEEVTVLHADATRLSEMEEARVGKSDVFIAATGHDEDNIVCGVEARELGAGRILTVVRRPDYANVLEKLGIDLAVSPRQTMARQVLGMVTSSPVIGLSSIAGGEAQVLEVEVLENAPVTRAALKDLVLNHTLVAAVEREGYVHVPGAEDQLRPGDTAVVLVPTRRAPETLNLFEPGNGPR